jgi:anti-anti-sigma factor
MKKVGNMDIRTRQESHYAVAVPQGRIDAVTAGEFETAIRELIGKTGCKCLIMNFENLEYISSAGLRAILAVAKVLKTGNGSLVFASLKDTVLNVFKISGFESMFSIYPNEEAAVEKARG